MAPEEYGKCASDNFSRGANCSQAVLLAFKDMLNMDEDTLMRLGSSFGGGIGRLREVCGAVSGMLMAQGLLEGYTFNTGDKGKHYKKVRDLAENFKDENGSILCRDLMSIRGLLFKSGGEPEPRTKEYYAARNCAEYCKSAAEILSRHLAGEK